MLAKKSTIFSSVQSSSTRTSNVGNKVLSKFYANNPSKRAGDNRSLDNDAYIKTNVGDLITCCTNEITGLTTTAPLTSANNPFTVSWDSLKGATYYNVSATNTGYFPTITHESPLSTTASIDYESAGGGTPQKVTISAYNYKGIKVSSTIDVLPCFLAGSLVHMFDGTTKPIEDVRVYDFVMGAFGEVNQVLFLHRPRLGNSHMCCINEQHHTTNHHPHVSVDKQFYCGDPDRVSNFTYGHTHTVMDEYGNLVEQMLYGLNNDRIHTLQTGVELKTIEGSQVVNTMELYSLPENTQLYNLVVDGSHTYYVDGYAVTGWPREDDFDYDRWCKR
jgi:hypothetical protein